MEIHRFGVKFFIAEPASLRLADLIPVFHAWIQNQSIEGHQLIDVQDYSHVHWGPGILLAAHEGNFSLDMDKGRPGLLYYRKQPGSLAGVLKAALDGCVLLEQFRFRTDEFLIVANDRLLAPNDEETFLKLKPELAPVLARLFPGGVAFERAPGSAKERLTIHVRPQRAEPVAAIRSRL